MTTQEISERTSTKYFIEYVCDYGPFVYYQLVRTSDLAIIYANSELDFVFAFCFKHHLSSDDVTLW